MAFEFGKSHELNTNRLFRQGSVYQNRNVAFNAKKIQSKTETLMQKTKLMVQLQKTTTYDDKTHQHIATRLNRPLSRQKKSA